MGTGIVAVASASLPLQFPGLRTAATVVWALAALMLVLLVVATVAHWVLFRTAASSHHSNPVMSHFYGAPAMAFLTVGAGALLLGKDWIGLDAALHIDLTLWIIGTALGILSAVIIPYLAFTRHDYQAASAFGGWLMPVVPPMVSASTGALLLPYLPAGQLRETMLWGGYALFGLSLVCSLVIITVLWQKLMMHGVGESKMVPTLWIVLGPVGQSITAVNLLAGNAASAASGSTARALMVFALIYGFAMAGFALLWTAVAIAITVRTAREGLPFTLTWWSFTFPVGTCVTGMSGLGLHSGLIAVDVLAVVFYVGLVVAWVSVASRTLYESVFKGTLFQAPLLTGRTS